MSRSRQTYKRKLTGRIAVLGEGRTEQFYLKHLKAIKGYTYVVKPSLFNNIKLKDAIKEIDRLLKEGYEAVVFFTDYDVVVENNKEVEYQKLKHKFRNKRVLICESMPSIEFWFLLHFIDTTKHYTNANQVVDELKKYLIGYEKKIDFLENADWVKKMCVNGYDKDAIKRAANIFSQKTNQNVDRHFPFTKAYLGIEKFEEIKT